MTSTLSASATPSTTPSAAPIQPMSTPCVMNTASMPRGRHAESAQDGDVGALVAHHHHQRRDDVESRDGHDQHQDQAHHGLLDADGAKIRLVLLRPVAHLETGREPRERRARKLGRLQHVLKLEPDPGRARESPRSASASARLTSASTLSCSCSPTSKIAGHLKILQARHDGAAGGGAVGNHDGDRIAHAHLQLVGQHASEHDAIHPRLQGRSICPRAWQSAMAETCVSRVGSMPRTMAPPMDGGRLSMASVSRKGAAPMRPGAPCSSLSARASRGWRPAGGRHGRVRRQAQQAAAQLALEAVHDRDDRDQRDHAQRDAEQRYPGDERDEKAVLAGQRVAQAHENGNGLKHFAAH